MIAVTGVTGKLGKLIVDHLLNKGIKANQIVGVVRNIEKASRLKDLGIELREANYDSKEQLQKALVGIEKLILVSSSDFGKRIEQHQNVIHAAKLNEVGLVAYTSVLRADSSKMMLAKDHIMTEEILKASGVSYIILRNSWYIENYTEQIENYLNHKVILGSTNNGRVSAATRSDYAFAAASAIIEAKKINTTYELAGEAFSLDELAGSLSEKYGQQIVHQNISSEELAKIYTSIGIPNDFAIVLADSDVGIARGDLFTTSNDLQTLIGKKPTGLKEYLHSL